MDAAHHGPNRPARHVQVGYAPEIPIVDTLRTRPASGQALALLIWRTVISGVAPSQTALSTTKPRGTSADGRSVCCMMLIPCETIPSKVRISSKLSQGPFWVPTRRPIPIPLDTHPTLLGDRLATRVRLVRAPALVAMSEREWDQERRKASFERGGVHDVDSDRSSRRRRMTLRGPPHHNRKLRQSLRSPGPTHHPAPVAVHSQGLEKSAVSFKGLSIPKCVLDFVA